jgi:deaminated glutathione amidase
MCRYHRETVRVGLCQVRAGEDVDANLAAVERVVRDVAARSVDLVALPEYAGYLGPQMASAVAPIGKGALERLLAALAEELGVWIVGGTVAERDADHVYDTAPLIDPGGEVVARYRKIHLFDVELPGQPPFRESATFRAGNELVTHEMPQARLGLAVCYDLRFPELFRALVERGAEMFLVTSAWPYPRVEAWTVLNRARALENQAWLISANCADGDPVACCGRSMVVDPWGTAVAAAGDRAGVLAAEIDPGAAKAARADFPALRDRVFDTGRRD